VADPGRALALSDDIEEAVAEVRGLVAGAA
jgi:hypothetical protein